MPLWRIHTAKDVYTPEDKKAFAESVTNFYCEVVGFPRFYTSVVFAEFDGENFLVGGEPAVDFVLIEILHVARNMNDLFEKYGEASEAQIYGAMREGFAAVIKPFVDDRNLRWESAVVEGLFETWVIDGMKPPPPWSEAEKQWARDNKPSPYEEPAPVTS